MVFDLQKAMSHLEQSQSFQSIKLLFSPSEQSLPVHISEHKQKPSFIVPLFSHFRGAVVVTAVVVVIMVIVLVVLEIVDGGRVEVVVPVELAMGGADVTELFEMSVVGKVVVAGSVV